MNGLPFLPYGVIPGEYKSKGLDTNIVMKAWRPALPESDRVATFNAWRKEKLLEFVEHLWPQFDFQRRVWVGPSTTFARDLTELEIDVMIDAFMGSDHILQTHPSSALASPDIENHLAHYEYEDQKPHPPGVNYRQYDRTLSTIEEEVFLDVMLKAISAGTNIGEKSAGHFWFKNNMQRPRPFHAAMVFRREASFVSELTERGQHPSIVSGHCFQGIMMACAVLEKWRATNPNLSQDRVDSLAQYMVDFGDRRVFAGVHYPTDNIASWVLALSLIPEVFDDHQPILDFVRKAVSDRSMVFQTVRNRFTRPDVQGVTKTVISLLDRYGLSIQATG